ncbi:hypothetical protein E4U11_006335 [Claviceps purpurea]|nr:hypothetical protein E4U11_006335 [Claviceps purpurea]
MVSHFVSMQLICEGVKRMMWAVVTPDSHSKNRTVIILGLPWLHDVGARFDIRDSELTIGIEERGDEVFTIRGPKVTLSDRQNIVLCPIDPAILNRCVGWEDADLSLNEESSDSDSDNSGN